MKKKMYCKTLVIGIIVLFIGAIVYPSSGITVGENPIMPTINGKTLYVGGSGPDNYTKIQDAINDAVNGYTVFVYADGSPYYENVVVDKSINLIGENKDTTVIDGNCVGDVVFISADGVTVIGFTIQNSDIWGPPEVGACIKIRSNANTIENNIIINPLTSGDGIYIEDSCTNNTITDNKISDNTFGIYFRWGYNYNTFIGNNIITDNDVGIVLRWKFNTVKGNTISKNKEDGIWLQGDNNTVIGNTFSKNEGCGIYISNSNKNTIHKNNFLQQRPAVGLWGSYTRNCWKYNYWNRPRILPKIIIGYIETAMGFPPIPYFNIDWRPAKEPYDI